MNAIGVIAPYKYEGLWVFDDPAVGLVREPFVAGIDKVIDQLVASIPNAQDGFRLLFSATPFPGHTVKLEWRREESGGNWYFLPTVRHRGLVVSGFVQVFRQRSGGAVCPRRAEIRLIERQQHHAQPHGLMIYLFPGMGAERRMYAGPWSSIKPRTCIEWPAYAGETSIQDLARRIIADHRIVPDDFLVGASLGGIVACEIAKTTLVAGLDLVGSARSREEINRFVSLIHPLIDLTPLPFAQRLAASVPGELAQMFSDSQASFIRAMCRAIFDWEGLGDVPLDLLRIHGRLDRVAAKGGAACLERWPSDRHDSRPGVR